MYVFVNYAMSHHISENIGIVSLKGLCRLTDFSQPQILADPYDLLLRKHNNKDVISSTKFHANLLTYSCILIAKKADFLSEHHL